MCKGCDSGELEDLDAELKALDMAHVLGPRLLKVRYLMLMMRPSLSNVERAFSLAGTYVHRARTLLGDESLHMFVFAKQFMNKSPEEIPAELGLEE